MMRRFWIFVAGLVLVAPLTAAPGQADDVLPVKPDVVFTDSEIQFSLPNSMPQATGMEITILGPGDEILLDQSVPARFFAWSPASATLEGYFRYEVRPVLPPTAGNHQAALTAPPARRYRFRAGSFSWDGEKLVDPNRHRPAQVGSSEAPTSQSGRVSVASPSSEADQTISDQTPAIFFDDTGTSNPDYSILTDANSPAFFQVVHGFSPVIHLRTDAGSDNTHSLVVNTFGDVGLGDDTAYVDRSSGRVGIGTAIPSAPLEIDADIPSIRFDPVGSQLWDIENNGFAFQFRDVNNDAVPFVVKPGPSFNTLVVDGAGRVGIGTFSPFATLDVKGNARVDGDVALGSSRTLKTAFDSVDPAEVLARVADLPVASWRYKSEDEYKRHIGPFAEDFQRLFGLGDGETISVIDAQGVALAAIQGLQQALVEKDAEVAALRQADAEREAQLVGLRKQVEALMAALASR